MTDINIISTSPQFCRLLELEAARMGLSADVNSADECRICLVDADTVPHFVSDGTVVLFGGSAELPNTHSATVHLEKPFLLTDLRRILHTLLSPQPTRPLKAKTKKVIKRAPALKLIIDHQKKAATVGAEPPVKLSETEYRLLCRLAEHGDTPLSNADVTDILGETESNKLNVYICFLRRKLERGNLRLIRTVRGKGYILDIH